MKNNLKFIDTHAHYNSSQFKKDRDVLLKDLNKDVKAIITLGTNTKTNIDTINLIKQYDFLYGMVGFFPNEVWEIDSNLCKNAKSNIDLFKEQLKDFKILGIGEIGLDYHWDCVGEKGKEIKGILARDYQKKWLLYQLILANELGLPVSLHSRDAESDTLLVFNSFKEIKGVMHCFSYGRKSMEAYLDKGLYIGVGGTITYPSNKELREAIKECPLDRILLETDAPYLTPEKERRTRNDSSKIKYVIDEISNLKNISKDEIIKQTNINANTLFKI